MSDLEELLRAELHDRVAAAEAEAEAPSEVGRLLTGGVERQVRRVRVRRRWTGAALSAAAVAAGFAIPLGLLAPRPSPLVERASGYHGPFTDTAATPKGWAPVASGDAQLSVPADWPVSAVRVCAGGRPLPGYVVLGQSVASLVARDPRCGQAANAAAILTLPGVPGAGATRYLNGIQVMRARSLPAGYTGYYAPSLHAVVVARGPLARRVLGTLTRSPLSVVLAKGPPSTPGRGWRWHHYRGIRFAAPGGWGVVRNGHWPCYEYWSAVVLIPAANRTMPRCPAVELTARTVAPPHGVIAAAPRYAARPSAYQACQARGGVRVCYSQPAGFDGELVVGVFAAGRGSAYLRIGLAGNGAVARAIFESIRAR